MLLSAQRRNNQNKLQAETAGEKHMDKQLLTIMTWLLFLGFPWAITAPLFMLMIAIMLRRRRTVAAPG